MILSFQGINLIHHEGEHELYPYLIQLDTGRLSDGLTALLTNVYTYR